MTSETSMRLLEAAAELDDRVARLVAAAEATRLVLHCGFFFYFLEAEQRPRFRSPI